MKIYGYVRVSGADQNEDRQMDLMASLGIAPERIFAEHRSGKNARRPQLRRLMETVRPGDTVVVESISRFARNTRDLLELTERLAAGGVEFVSQKEHIDTTTPTGKFMLTVFGAVAELERAYLLQRQAEGIAAAKRRGKHLGRPAAEMPECFGELVDAWERKTLPLAEVLRQCGGISEAPFYRRLAEYRAKREEETKSALKRRTF